MSQLSQPNPLYSIVLHWLLQLPGLPGLMGEKRPLIIGINGPQGCGKSTVAKAVVEGLRENGIAAISLSIDDFYLTRQSQLELASRHPSNPYLQQRGYPGTHDIELGRATLEAMKRIQETGNVFCPVYDKSLHQGQGDRLPASSWKKISAPLQVVLFEGWMLGFTRVPDSSIHEESLREVNRLLKGYEAWHQFLNGFIQLSPLDINFTVDWRVEAEEKMKLEGKSGMSRQQISNYILKFLPAYEAYLPHLLKCPPRGIPYLQLTLTKERLPI